MPRRALLMVVVLCSSLSAAPTIGAPSAQALAAFERAEKALAAESLDTARLGYLEALKEAPDYAAAHNGLGSVLFKLGNKEEAIASFRKAIEADPGFKLAHFNLGYSARKVEDYETAVAAYQRYTQLDPADPDGFYGLAESYRALGRNAEAVRAYRTYVATEKRPSEQAWIDRAKESIAALEPAPPPPPDASIAPPSPPGLSQVAGKLAAGDAFMSQKDFRAASVAYQEAVDAEPSNVEALFKAGKAYAVIGYYSQAIERWTRVLQLSQDAAVRRSAEENIARARGKLAASAAQPSAGAKPPSGIGVAAARAAYEQGVRQVTTRDYTGALVSLTRAIEGEPTLAVAYVARGSAFIGLKRFNDAAADYHYALRLEPAMASPLYGLAECYRAMGRRSDAKAYYERYVASRAPDVRAELQVDARGKAERL